MDKYLTNPRDVQNTMDKYLTRRGDVRNAPERTKKRKRTPGDVLGRIEEEIDAAKKERDALAVEVYDLKTQRRNVVRPEPAQMVMDSSEWKRKLDSMTEAMARQRKSFNQSKIKTYNATRQASIDLTKRLNKMTKDSEELVDELKEELRQVNEENQRMDVLVRMTMMVHARKISMQMARRRALASTENTRLSSAMYTFVDTPIFIVYGTVMFHEMTSFLDLNDMLNFKRTCYTYHYQLERSENYWARLFKEENNRFEFNRMETPFIGTEEGVVRCITSILDNGVADRYEKTMAIYDYSKRYTPDALMNRALSLLKLC